MFALNWLGLALTPCAMAAVAPTGGAHAVAAEASAGTRAGASAASAFDAEALAAMSPECRARMLAGAAPPDAAGPSTPHAAAPCPWCLEGAPTPAASHDAGCGATSKPALDARDMKGFQSPLLVALSATVLAFVPLDTLAPRAFAAEPELPADPPALDRYCRRLE